jgi:hypothetical protein
MPTLRCVPVLLIAFALGCASTSTRTPPDGPGSVPPDPTGDSIKSRAAFELLYAREDNPHFGKLEHFDVAPSESGWSVRTRSEQWFVGHAPPDGGESGSSRSTACTPWVPASTALQPLLDAHSETSNNDAVIAQLKAELLKPDGSSSKSEPTEKACEAKP